MKNKLASEKYLPSSFRHPDNQKMINENQMSGLQRVVKLKFIIDGK